MSRLLPLPSAARVHACGALLLTLAALLALVGCGGGGDSPTAPTSNPSTDLDAVTAVVAGASALSDDGLYDVISSATASARHAGAFAVLDPLSFHRTVNRSTLGISVVFSDSDGAGHPRAAEVTVRRSTLGMFMVLRRPAGGGAVDTSSVVHKVMDDRWTRHLHLTRQTVQGPYGPQEVWSIDQASALRIASQPGSRTIASVHLTGIGLDATLTDAEALRTPAQMPVAVAGDSLTITVGTGANTGANADNDVFVYWGDRRVRMIPNGDGTHTVRVHSGNVATLRSLGVNVLSRGTLHDDALPYDSLGWIVPLRIGATLTSARP